MNLQPRRKLSSNNFVMKALYTSVILAILCTSVACAIGLQSPKSTGRNSKTKELQGLFKGTKCGISATAPTGGRIVGGEEAMPHSWPWQVWIMCAPRKGQRPMTGFCGGSIVSDKWIVTAAHCAYSIDKLRDCQVLLGKHDLPRNESTQVVAKIADYFFHEKYNFSREKGYDVALLKLAKPLKFTDAIQPICLPFGLPELQYNKSCYVTGWGITDLRSPNTSRVLKQLSLRVTAEKYCHASFHNPRTICTLPLDPTSDPCFGDSGGPLACKEQDRKWYLRGVVSWGGENCSKSAVFTKVTSYEKWIKNITSRY